MSWIEDIGLEVYEPSEYEYQYLHATELKDIDITKALLDEILNVEVTFRSMVNDICTKVLNGINISVKQRNILNRAYSQINVEEHPVSAVLKSKELIDELKVLLTSCNNNHTSYNVDKHVETIIKLFSKYKEVL